MSAQRPARELAELGAEIAPAVQFQNGTVGRRRAVEGDLVAHAAGRGRHGLVRLAGHDERRAHDLVEVGVEGKVRSTRTLPALPCRS
jgi:hypothetical protein